MDPPPDGEGNKPELRVDVINTESLGSVAVIKNVYGFSVDPRFTDLVPIGQGGNGMVFSAVDSDCEKNVAIKKICFTDQKSCKYALRELRVMRQLQHENLVSIYEILGPNGFSMDGKHTTTPNSSDFNSFYIVQEHMDISLAQIIQNASLSQDHIRFFLYQMLRGLKYIHSANIIHRDIKPSNILLSLEDLVLKIGDFGLARVVDPTYCHRGYLTDRIGTCWYRAPELILTPRDYTSAIDIWGVGCILGELVTGQPLFPGAQEMEQIGHVLDTISLTDNEWNTVTQVLPRTVMKKHQRFPQMSLKSRLPTVDNNAKDLLESLLVFSPSSRLTAEKALSHPYLHQYSCLQNEPIVSRPFSIEHEVDDLPIENLRQLLLNESRAVTDSCGSQCTTERSNSPGITTQEPSNQDDKPLVCDEREACSLPGNPSQREATLNSAQYSHARVNSPANVGQDIVRDKNTQSSCRSLKESLFIDITEIENAKEFCQLSPKEKVDRTNCQNKDKSYDKNNPNMLLKMKDRLNEKRRGQSPSDSSLVNSADPLQSTKPAGDWEQLGSTNERVFPFEHHSNEKVEDKNIRNSPDGLLHREKSRSKESLFRKQMGRQKKNKQRAMNVRDFDNLYRLPTEHLRRRRRTDDRLLSIKPLPEYNNIENHVKLREELNERLRLAEMERDHIRGAVGGTCTLDEIARPIRQITLDNDHIWNTEKEVCREKKSGFGLTPEKNTGKTRRDSSSSSDDQRFEG